MKILCLFCLTLSVTILSSIGYRLWLRRVTPIVTQLIPHPATTSQPHGSQVVVLKNYTDSRLSELQIATRGESKKVIFLFGCPPGLGEDFVASDRCVLTRNVSLHDIADAVIIDAFYNSTEWKSLPPRSNGKQIYVYLNRESSLRSPYFGWMNDTFNLTISHLSHPDTDMQIPYGRVDQRDASDPYKDNPLKIMRRKTKQVAWVVSHCITHSGREEYVLELRKHIDVDIYGRCNNHQCESNSCFSNIEEKYWFYLAFENSLCKGYVTEKFFRPLEYHIVPVVLGGGNYSAMAPPHSFIDVSDFSSPRHLASYLRYLIAHPKEYLRYFEWKKLYSVSTCRRLLTALRSLCDILYNPGYQYKTGFDLWKYYYGNSPCISGHRALHKLGINSRMQLYKIGLPNKPRHKKWTANWPYNWSETQGLREIRVIYG